MLIEFNTLFSEFYIQYSTYYGSQFFLLENAQSLTHLRYRKQISFRRQNNYPKYEIKREISFIHRLEIDLKPMMEENMMRQFLFPECTLKCLKLKLEVQFEPILLQIVRLMREKEEIMMDVKELGVIEHSLKLSSMFYNEDKIFQKQIMTRAQLQEIDQRIRACEKACFNVSKLLSRGKNCDQQEYKLNMALLMQLLYQLVCRAYLDYTKGLLSRSTEYWKISLKTVNKLQGLINTAQSNHTPLMNYLTLVHLLILIFLSIIYARRNNLNKLLLTYQQAKSILQSPQIKLSLHIQYIHSFSQCLYHVGCETQTLSSFTKCIELMLQSTHNNQHIQLTHYLPHQYHVTKLQSTIAFLDKDFLKAKQKAVISIEWLLNHLHQSRTTLDLSQRNNILGELMNYGFSLINAKEYVKVLEVFALILVRIQFPFIKGENEVLFYELLLEMQIAKECEIQNIRHKLSHRKIINIEEDTQQSPSSVNRLPQQHKQKSTKIISQTIYGLAMVYFKLKQDYKCFHILDYYIRLIKSQQPTTCFDAYHLPTLYQRHFHHFRQIAMTFIELKFPENSGRNHVKNFVFKVMIELLGKFGHRKKYWMSELLKLFEEQEVQRKAERWEVVDRMCRLIIMVKKVTKKEGKGYSMEKKLHSKFNKMITKKASNYLTNLWLQTNEYSSHLNKITSYLASSTTQQHSNYLISYINSISSNRHQMYKQKHEQEQQKFFIQNQFTNKVKIEIINLSDGQLVIPEKSTKKQKIYKIAMQGNNEKSNLGDVLNLNLALLKEQLHDVWF